MWIIKSVVVSYIATMVIGVFIVFINYENPLLYSLIIWGTWIFIFRYFYKSRQIQRPRNFLKNNNEKRTKNS